MAYTDKTAIENLLLIEIDASFDAQVAEWIAAVQLFIDNYTGKTFESGAASTKYYDGNGTDRIFIDPIVGTPTEVSILDNEGNVSQTLTINTDYLLYPLNATAKDEIVILTAIDWDESDLWEGSFPQGNKRLKVVSDFWSSATVPADIKLIATRLVANIISGQMNGVGREKTSESLGDYSVSYGAIAQDAERVGFDQVLERYRDPSI